MKINYSDMNVVYIDPAISTAGNGSTPATALKVFPNTLSANTIYLVRRVTNRTDATMPVITSNVENLTIWGMPKNGEKHWNDVPAAARTAWGNDDDNAYAIVGFTEPSGDNSTLTLTNCYSIDLYNFTFMSSHTNDDDRFCIKTTTASHGTSLSADHVIFTGSKNIYNGYASGSDNLYQYSNGKYLSLTAGSNGDEISATLKITNCDIYFRYRGNRPGIVYNYVGYIEVDNCNFFCMPNPSYESVVLCSSNHNNTDNINPIVKFTNSNIFYKDLGMWDSTRFPAAFYFRASVAHVDNINIKYLDEMVGTSRVIPDTFYSPIVSYVRGYGSVFSNIKCEMPKYTGINSTVLFVHSYENSHHDINTSQYIPVKNITITCNTDGTAYNKNNYSIGVTPYTTESDTNYAHLIRLHCGYDDNIVYPSSHFVVQNLNITAPFAYAFQGYRCLLDMASTTIQGACSFQQCIGKIGKIKSDGMTQVVRDNGRNLLYIGEIECNKTRTEYTGQHAIYIPDHDFWTSNLLIGTTNTKCYDDVYINDRDWRCSYICTNNQRSGNYTCRNLRHFCQTWSIYRTGADNNCTLKLFNESTSGAQLNCPLKIGGLPFKGITKHVTAGTHTATIYLTTYGYTTPSDIVNHLKVYIKTTGGDIYTTSTDTSVVTNKSYYLKSGSDYILIDNPSGNPSTKSYYERKSLSNLFIDTDGYWEQDNVSEWNNIEDGSAFKLVIPFEVASEQDIEFEYRFNWYHKDAATYLEPFPVID